MRTDSAERSAAPAPSVVVRPAHDCEARACRILLPEMFSPTQAPDVLVATSVDPTQPGRIRLVGAAGLGMVHGSNRREFPVLVHVIPSHRRRGIGRALIAASVERCRGRTDFLRALRPVPSESQAAAFLAACGFDHADRIVHFETDAPAFLDAMARVRERLEQRRRVPVGARIVPLRDAPADAVADLVSMNFPVTRSRVRERLDPRASDGYDLQNSVALLVGETVGGVLIFGWTGAVPVIEVRVVDHALRGGWANVLLLEGATRNGVEAGAARFRFFADETVSDTMSLARRAGADQIKVERHFWRSIA